MRHASSTRLLSPILIPAVLLPSLVLVAVAEEPLVAIRLGDGGSAIYPVLEINRIGFQSDTMFVLGAEGLESYSLASINRIEFMWGVSGATPPEDGAGLPTALSLLQNRPNPFTPMTRIAFELAQPGWVEMGIYSVDGRLIRMLAEEEHTAGRHEVLWDGRDAAGKKVAGGIYFCRLVAPTVAESRRMILLP